MKAAKVVVSGGRRLGDVSGKARTRSASESSSCPIRLDLWRQRATLPSIKSKNRPKGMKARAAQRGPRSVGSPRQ